MINRYKKFLSILDLKLARMFERQAAFIKCKKGCAYCCKEGTYPISELEYINMMFEYHSLPDDIKETVTNRILDLIKDDMPKLYECPFLIDNSCIVYPARPLICRVFGLLAYYKDESKTMPFCVEMGLNYAESYNAETKKLEKKAADGTEPIAFNIDRRTLRSEDIERDFKLNFGKDKKLYDYLKEDFEKYL